MPAESLVGVLVAYVWIKIFKYLFLIFLIFNIYF